MDACAMTDPTNRIAAYDQTRALAIIGMVLVNTRTIMSRQRLEPWWIDAFIDFITGRAAVLFVMLAGAGMVMAYDRTPDVAKPLLRKRLVIRAAWLSVMGFLLMTVWKADILHYYTAYIIGGVILLNHPTRWLRRMLIVLVAVSIPVCALVVYESEGGLIIERLVRPGPLASLLDYLFFSSCYPVLPWIGFFMLGMLLGRAERKPRKRRFQILFISSIGFMAIELLSALLNSDSITGRWFDIDEPGWRAFSLSEAFPVGPLFIFSGGALGLALISFFRWLPAQAWATRHLNPLSAFGRLSLTFYVSHILLGHAYHQWIIQSQGIITSSQVLFFAVAFIMVGMAFALLWTRCFRRGPLEMAMNALTCAFMKPARTVWRAYAPPVEALRCIGIKSPSDRYGLQADGVSGECASSPLHVRRLHKQIAKI
jgi:uncharacterized membrane protein YeiB